MPGWLRDRRPLLGPAVVVVAIVPIVVATVRALARGWVAIGDDGLLLLRTQDVATANHPLLGTWTSASLSAGRVDQQPGTALVRRAGAVREGRRAVGGVRRRRDGRQHRRRRAGGVGGAAGRWRAGDGAGDGAVGRPGVVDGQRAALRRLAAARHAAAVLGPADPAVGARGRAAVDAPVGPRHRQPARADPPGVRLRGRDHRGGGDRRRCARRPPRPGDEADAVRWRRPLVASAVVVVLAWIQPLIDQVAGEGNLGALLRSGSGGDDGRRLGLRIGIRLVGSVVALPPWWTRPGFSDTIRPTGRDHRRRPAGAERGQRRPARPGAARAGPRRGRARRRDRARLAATRPRRRRPRCARP